jgi:hypothetical protein
VATVLQGTMLFHKQLDNTQREGKNQGEQRIVTCYCAHARIYGSMGSRFERNSTGIKGNKIILKINCNTLEVT